MMKQGERERKRVRERVLREGGLWAVGGRSRRRLQLQQQQSDSKADDKVYKAALPASQLQRCWGCCCCCCCVVVVAAAASAAVAVR